MNERISNSQNSASNLARRPTLRPGDPDSLPYESDYNAKSGTPKSVSQEDVFVKNWPAEVGKIIGTIQDGEEQGRALEALIKKLPPAESKDLPSIRHIITRIRQSFEYSKLDQAQAATAQTKTSVPSGYDPKNPEIYRKTFKEITTAIVRSRNDKEALQNANSVISKSKLGLADQGNLRSTLPRLLGLFSPPKAERD